MLVITLGLDLHFLLLSNMVWETFLDLGYIFDDNVGTLLVHPGLSWLERPASSNNCHHNSISYPECELNILLTLKIFFKTPKIDPMTIVYLYTVIEVCNVPNNLYDPKLTWHYFKISVDMLLEQVGNFYTNSLK